MRVPVAAEGVEFRGNFLGEGVNAFGETFARNQMKVQDTAVAKADTATDFGRKFDGKAHDAIRGGLEDEIGKAIERCWRVVLQDELSVGGGSGALELLREDRRFLRHTMNGHAHS